MTGAIFRTMVAGAIAMAATQSLAAQMNPGDTIFIPGSTAESAPHTTGAIVQDELLNSDILYIPAGQNTAAAGLEVHNRVVRSAADGTMVFMPRVDFGFNITSSLLLVDRIEMFGFGDYEIDASYRTDLEGDRGPTTGTRSANGETLDFTFEFPLLLSNLFQGPHESSYHFALATDATGYQNTGAMSVYARSVEGDFSSYRFDVFGLAVPRDAPQHPDPAPVPLPASVLLLLSGLGATYRLRRTSKG